MGTKCSAKAIGSCKFEDMLSYLPSNVMDCIMDHLPLQDPARMAVMSRKWKDIWKSLPYLKFDAQFFKQVLNKYDSADIVFFGIVSKILLSHNGPIPRFFLHIPYMISERPDVSPFINFLLDNGVREITIENCCSSSFDLPSDIFSCVELKSLKLDYCTVLIPPTFKCFNNLIRLQLDNVIFIGGRFKRFFAGCPVLETLVLKEFSGVDHPTIEAPNLKFLNVWGMFKSISLKGCPGLQSVTIGLLGKVANSRGEKARDLFDFVSKSCKVQELNIGGHYFEFMAVTCYWGVMNWTFKELRLLQLSNVDANNFFQFHCAAGLIRSCPNLEELVISFRSTACSSECEVNFDPCYKHGHLCRVSFDSVSGFNTELNLIEFLLACSPELEKFNVKCNPKIESGLEWKIARALMRFPRASTKAEILYMNPAM